MNMGFIINQGYTYKSRGGNMVLHVDCKSTDLGFDSLLALDYRILGPPGSETPGEASLLLIIISTIKFT